MGTIGRTAVCTINDGGGPTAYNGAVSYNYKHTNELADDTTMDSAGWKEAVMSNRQVVLDISGKYSEAAGGQLDAMVEAVSSFGTVAVVFTPAGGDTFSFTANISNFSIDAVTAETIDVSFTLESTGAVAYGAVP